MPLTQLEQRHNQALGYNKNGFPNYKQLELINECNPWRLPALA